MAKEFIENKGFTLVELLIAMAISGILVTSMYSVYTLQQRSYTVQDQVSEIQQKARAALDIMTREIRMATYDPGKNCAATIHPSSNETKLVFDTCDPGDDLCPECRVTFEWDDATDTLQMTKDQGRDDASDPSLPLDNLLLTIARGVDAVEFKYFDEDGKPVLASINASTVRISLLVRATYPDRKYTNTTLYQPASVLDGGSLPDTWANLNGSGGNPANDNFHRRLLITTVQMRNARL
ncbi:type IV pilus assembly protein PilW [Candidatus Electrothrix aarhusensis]|uniref:Type IV pilus assembly protein PilW n=1 Tax=Candidatus Electrothrix aarhusensis TaxID=1859131 RepID=A0A444IQ19_9BACT|nr:type IV pilus assembly protein PilW [Candidatus Electrothrix aarhusensis]